MGAVQAQDYGGAKWALGLRLAGDAAKDSTLEQAIAEGTIVRTHALRGTWQLVAPADIRWMLELVAPRLIASNARRYRELELGASAFRRSNAVISKALHAGHLTRVELAAALGDAGISAAGQRLAYMLQRAELDALICGGARRGKQSTHRLLENRAAHSGEHLRRDDMLASLAERYFRSRGPATLQDFKWWSGLSSSEAQTAHESIKSMLDFDVLDGRTYWRSHEKPLSSASPMAHLLPAFDEYLIAYQDRDAVLDPKYANKLNAGGGILSTCIVLDGRVIGTWRRTLARQNVAIELDLFEAAKPPEHQAIADAARRYAAFLSLEASVATRSRGKQSTARRRSPQD
jgi:hypothetical protein